MRLLVLALPTALLAALLVAHSLATLPRRRALTFWGAAAGYGVLRGIGVRLATERGLRASFPYVIHHPLLSALGVSLQEVAGWTVVSYLGWWLGRRFATAYEEREAPRLYPQIAWACVFLGAIAWAIEPTAIAAGWWHWTLPATRGVIGNVPLVGLLDWSFVGIDFLMPFVALTASSTRRSRWRFLTLGAFPFHFACHAVPGVVAGWLPIPVPHLAHWILGGTVLWLAFRSDARDASFRDDTRSARLLPLCALGVILADVLLVQTFWARRPELLLTIVPALLVGTLSLRPRWSLGFALAGAALFPVEPALALLAAPALLPGALRWGLRHRSLASAGLVAVLAIAAPAIHRSAARSRLDLTARLDRALAARDRGDVESARRDLEALCRDHAGEYAPHALLGELAYRLDRLGEARASFLSAVTIKQDFVRGQRYLVVIDLRRGDRPAAAARAAQALEIAPDDPELGYLAERARGDVGPERWARAVEAGPERAFEIASLAFEVGDTAGAAELLDRALARWPQDRPLRDARRRLAQDPSLR